ncbi:serine/threonine-protein phosphatase [Streptomyces sp. Je 1-79]|uniref:PP2C family protein-serine/threonine phosphatase n=1 Tax=Streptomyces sp. Je 1-79 TaxID=2943847 RepID=UPI0021A95F8A|nr:PP2C family protein-serine/threonine phosphatase [Streptomyces sp. Je 1-79]MCT4353910.1 serine/threonine-protein phosphatase [Streptomyces sp. Je 1-79]
MPALDSAPMLRALLRASHRATFEQLPELLTLHAGRAGLHNARLFVADLQEDVLREVTGVGPDAGRAGQELAIDSTLCGRVFRTAEALSTTTAGTDDFWLPVLNGTERLGVLRLTPSMPVNTVEQDGMNDLATLLGLILVTKRPISDSYARLTRTRRMAVSAEMQWTLMPARTFVNDRVTIAAQMEPAYETAGDAYDYAIAGDIVHLAVFDAMGHDTAAGLTANLALAVCRNLRRHGAGFAEMCDAVEALLLAHFDHERYVTGILATLDLDTGTLRWVNCGHPPPVFIRANRRVHRPDDPAHHPLGTDLGLPLVVSHTQLQPGDRVLFYTDGITEPRDADGRQFGVDRFTDFVIRHQAAGLPVPETLRRLVHAVLEHNDGTLDDDATVLLCEWHGSAERTGELARTAAPNVYPS